VADKISTFAIFSCFYKEKKLEPVSLFRYIQQVCPSS